MKKDVIVWDGPEGMIRVDEATREQLLEIIEDCFKTIEDMRRAAKSDNETWAALSGVRK